MDSAKRRLQILQSNFRQLCNKPTTLICPSNSSQSKQSFNTLQSELKQRGVEVAGPPKGCEISHNTLLTQSAITFLCELVRTFNTRVDKILQDRILRKLKLDMSNSLPDFNPLTAYIRDGAWLVAPVPCRLECRHVDLGDVSPSNRQHFIAALKSSAQGIQTDFDDGHCPSWSNQLQGLYNVCQAVHSEIPGVPAIGQAPILMLRPRAWNMVEHNMMVDGREVPGPLFDFGLLMFHNAQMLTKHDSGPFFYLSKLENATEARLWDDIFRWTQHKLGIPVGTIKACVLIENILASFEMNEILYELKDHSLGLNCGMWDYSASFVNKFGHRADFVLPDRSKYVSMDRHFLKSYMDLLIQTCHHRGCHATGGMSAILLPPGGASRIKTIEKACSAKLKEIQSGADGFMVYDLDLVRPMHQMFEKFSPTPNQHHIKRTEIKIHAKDLLAMPTGGVTMDGLKHNIAVGVLFIYHWLKGQGHYYYKGAIEDSATAEISRSQVWQWIYHRATLEDNSETITRHMTHTLIGLFIEQCCHLVEFSTETDRMLLETAAGIFNDIITRRDFPEFITTYLNLEHTFLEKNMS